MVVRVLAIVFRDIALTPFVDDAPGFSLVELHAGRRYGAAVGVAVGDAAIHIFLAYC
jgi:hypothetical protein